MRINGLSTLHFSFAHKRLAQVHVMNPRGVFLEEQSNGKVDALGTVPQVSKVVAFGFEVVLSRNNTMYHNFCIWLILENSFGNIKNTSLDEIVFTLFNVQVIRTNNDVPQLWAEVCLLDAIFPVPE